MIERFSQKTRAIIFVSSVVVVIVCLAWIVSRVGRGNSAHERKPIYLYCAACDEVYKVKRGLDEEPPLVCKRCGETAAWIAMRCRDCGKVFPFAPPVDEEGNVIRRNPVCPKCGGARYSRYDPKKEE